MRPERTLFQLGSQVVQEILDPDLLLDVSDPQAVHTRSTGPGIARDPVERHDQRRPIVHEVEQIIEPAARISRRPTVKLGLYGIPVAIAEYPTNLFLTLPGQTFTNGIANSGTVSNQTAGTPFNLVKLTATEYVVLRLFVQHAGKVLTHRHILREVWGPNHEGDTQYLRVYMARLREKLESDSAAQSLFLTEPGVGYRMIEAKAA